MHDDQHIVRLLLLDQGLRQGYLYPRWVDGLGFGFGYPLYNFYPPLIYYTAELFHLIGFSLIWSVKLTFILGFYLGALGIYFLVKKLTNRLSGFLSATLYTYFFYHAVLIYVRGALAEFFSLAILPFVFLTFHNLANKPNKLDAIFFGITLAFLILTHPLIAVPSVFFLLVLFALYLLLNKNRSLFILFTCLGIFVGISLSAFFWMPSVWERKYTLVDKILTAELASYKLHYIYLQQFIYSPWGYGGSGVGLTDGMTFQLGKIHIGLSILSVLVAFVYFVKKRKLNFSISYYLLTIIFLLFSLFMTTEYSSFIWDRVKYLWYLQFPWRFLTFAAIFISIVGGYFVFFLSRLLHQLITPDRWNVAISHSHPVTKYGVNSSGNPELNRFRIKSGMILVAVIVITFTIFTYQKYFKPQRFIVIADKERTSYEEITWGISRTSYEFVPKGVKTKKSDLNTTILAIEKKDLPKKTYDLLSGDADVRILENKFQNKKFFIDAKNPARFRLNTYHFPGWKAYLNSKEISIDDKNDLKLITIRVPSGKYILNFSFRDTFIRSFSNAFTLGGFVLIALVLVLQFKKVYG